MYIRNDFYHDHIFTYLHRYIGEHIQRMWQRVSTSKFLSKAYTCQHCLSFSGPVFEIYMAAILAPENKIGTFHSFHPSVHSVSPVEDVQQQAKPSEGREEKSRAQGSRRRPGQQSNKLFVSTSWTPLLISVQSVSPVVPARRQMKPSQETRRKIKSQRVSHTPGQQSKPFVWKSRTPLPRSDIYMAQPGKKGYCEGKELNGVLIALISHSC